MSEPTVFRHEGGALEEELRALFSGRAAEWPALLVVAGGRVRETGWAAEAAVELASLAAQAGRVAVLADLGVQGPTLHAHLGVANDEGLSDVLLFGVTVRRAARPVGEGAFSFIPAGPPGPGSDGLLAHPNWERVLSEAARRKLLLLLYTPSDAPDLSALAERVGRGIVLGALEDRAALPGGFEAVAVLSPPGEEPAAPEEAPAPDAPPSGPADEGPRRELTLEEWIHSEDAWTDPAPPAVEPLPVPTGDEDGAEEGAEPAGPAEETPLPLPLPAPGALPERSGKGAPAQVVSRYAVPRLSEGRERLFRGLAVLALAYSAYYILWRWTSTLNLDALWFSVPLALAETWAVLTAFITIHSVWRLRHRKPTPPPRRWPVDVFITCYDEPLEVIRRTAVGARAIRYPHTTYILDDGKREEVRAMAEQLGVEYIRREGNEHAKAGNLNHALQHTRGDYILQLDADHVPLPHILDRLLGFFAQDPRLAFVQSPQDFYNTDGFTYDLDEGARRIWEEQRLFFTIIQPGKDARNAAFFCGSCAVIRRAALDDIGGFSTYSITEDIETSIRLHSRGWSSAYYGESLAYGLAPGSATAFHTQHLRWGQGAMQVLRKFNPLTYPGLSLSQRISYFGSLTAYVSGVQRLILYTAPLVFFFTGVFPVRAGEGEFLARFLPFLALSFLLSEVMARGTSHAWISERYGMAKFWTHTRAVASYFSRRPLRFRVTPKGPGDVPFRSYAPHVVLMGATLASVLWAVAARHYGWVDYRVPGWSSGALLINLLWAALNFALAAAVVQLSRRVRQQRGDYRFRDEFPINLRVEESRPGEPSTFVALTENLNPNGVAFRSGRRLEAGSRIEATLPLITATVRVSGEVVHSEPVEGAVAAMFRTGVRFQDVAMNARDAIELHCAHHAVPLEKAMYGKEIPLLSRTTRWMRDARSEPRKRVHLPARVWIGRTRTDGGASGKRMGFLQDVSTTGARLVLDEPVPPGSPVRYYVPGTDIRGEGRVVFSHATETPIGVRFAVGVRRSRDFPREPDPERTMRIPEVVWRVGGWVGLSAGLGAAAAPLQAQLQPVVYGAAEMDTQETALFLIGASVAPTSPGLAPVAGAHAYYLTFRTGAETDGRTVSLTAVNPYAGLRQLWPTGLVQLTAGYLFVEAGEDSVGGGFGAPGGTESGVTTALQANYWGTTGVRTGQAIASYNWGAQYFWGQLRGLQQVATFGGGPLRVGAEVVGQTGGADEEVQDYAAIQFGPVVEVSLSPAFRVAGSAGAKSDNRPQSSTFFPYFKVDFVVVP